MTFIACGLMSVGLNLHIIGILEESFDGLDDKDKDEGKEFKRALEKQDWDKVKKMYTKNPGL